MSKITNDHWRVIINDICTSQILLFFSTFLSHFVPRNIIFGSKIHEEKASEEQFHKGIPWSQWSCHGESSKREQTNSIACDVVIYPCQCSLPSFDLIENNVYSIIDVVTIQTSALKNRYPLWLSNPLDVNQESASILEKPAPTDNNGRRIPLHLQRQTKNRITKHEEENYECPLERTGKNGRKRTQQQRVAVLTHSTGMFP
ncbi:MAG: hypothetical protein ACI363_04790 [Phocaeicola plebeius]